MRRRALRHADVKTLRARLTLGYRQPALRALVKTPFSILTAALLLLAFACGPRPSQDAGLPEDDAGQDSDAGFDAGRPKPDAGPFDAGFGAVAIEDWCRTDATAQCLRSARCTRLDSTFFNACLTRKLLLCDEVALTRGVHEGRLSYEPAAAAACINAYASGSCEGVPAPCANLFKGKVAPDGGCTLEEECDSAQGFCDPYTFACPQRCLPWLKTAESCSDFRTQCNPAADSCQIGDAGTSVCLPHRVAGQPCVSFSDCRDDLVCVNSQCVSYRAKEGEVCGVSSGYPYCDDSTFCRQMQVTTGTPPPGTCERRPGLGGTCVGYGTCLPALHCSSSLATGVCEPLGKIGDDCSDTYSCQDELYCSPGSARCTALPTDGGDCTNRGSSYTCAAGYTCDFSAPSGLYVCARLRALGETCRYASDCLSNECEYQTTADGGFEQRCSAPCSHLADGGF